MPMFSVHRVPTTFCLQNSRLFPGFFSKFKVFRNRKTRNAKPFESYFLTYIPCFNEKLRFKEHSNSMIVISFLYLASYKLQMTEYRFRSAYPYRQFNKDPCCSLTVPTSNEEFEGK